MKGIVIIVLIIIAVNFVRMRSMLVIFNCEVYGNCRKRHQPLFHGNEHNLKTLPNDNQTGIAWLLWDIRKIRMNIDMEC